MSSNSIDAPLVMDIHVEVRLRRVVRLVLLALPAILLIASLLPAPGVIYQALQVLGGLTLIFVPGYAVLAALRADPLVPGAPASLWALTVPVSLAADVLTALLLVLSPVGLSAVSLWTVLCVLSVVSLLLVRKV